MDTQQQGWGMSCLGRPTSERVGTQGPLTPHLLLCPLPCSLQVCVDGTLMTFSQLILNDLEELSEGHLTALGCLGGPVSTRELPLGVWRGTPRV